MVIIQKYLSLGRMARGDTRNTKNPLYFTQPLEKIILHWVGPYPHHTPDGVRHWWENGSDGRGVRASAHFIVKNDIILQCIPLDEIACHSGDLRNYNSIGIEVIPMNATGEFDQLTIKTLKDLIKHIGENAGKDLMLERHYDGAQKKDCPRFYTPVTSLLDGGGRVVNPNGGNERWEALKQFLNAA